MSATDAEIAAITAGLSKAQREAFEKVGDEWASASQMCKLLGDKRHLSRTLKQMPLLVAQHRFRGKVWSCITALGLDVRARLAAQTKEPTV